MPQRNFITIMLAALVSVVCYNYADRTRYAAVFASALNEIEDNYVEDVDQRTLFDAAMHGMMDKLDVHSQYISPDQIASFNAEIDQQFGGIGVEVTLDPEKQRPSIVSPMPGTPAYKAGALAGDVIMAVNGKSTAGWKLEDAVKVIRGPIGETVVISVLHPGESEPVDLKIKRGEIKVDSVLGDVRNSAGKWSYVLQEHPNIGYVRIVNFGQNTANELAVVLHNLMRRKIDGLILDLRGDPGGLLDVAVEICDMFIDRGVIVSTRGRGGVVQSAHYASKRATIVDENLPIAILVDQYSASASEIFAACLQDYKRAVIVGDRTWGKGTVQNITKLEGGRSEMKLTVATYWRPSGKNIHRWSKDRDENGEWGVVPDPGMEVKMSRDQYGELYKWQRQRDAFGRKDHEDDDDQPQARPDPVLRRAVEYLEKEIADRP